MFQNKGLVKTYWLTGSDATPVDPIMNQNIESQEDELAYSNSSLQ